jgi:hypothetical protein
MMAEAEPSEPSEQTFDPKPDRSFKGKQIFDDNGAFAKFWRSIFPGPEARRQEVAQLGFRLDHSLMGCNAAQA